MAKKIAASDANGGLAVHNKESFDFDFVVDAALQLCSQPSAVV